MSYDGCHVCPVTIFIASGVSHAGLGPLIWIKRCNIETVKRDPFQGEVLIEGLRIDSCIKQRNFHRLVIDFVPESVPLVSNCNCNANKDQFKRTRDAPEGDPTRAITPRRVSKPLFAGRRLPGR